MLHKTTTKVLTLEDTLVGQGQRNSLSIRYAYYKLHSKLRFAVSTKVNCQKMKKAPTNSMHCPTSYLPYQCLLLVFLLGQATPQQWWHARGEFRSQARML